MGYIFVVVVVATSIWAAVDAGNLAVRRGGLDKGGFLDLGPAGWFVACLLLWIVAFPLYLNTRRRYISANLAGHPPMGAPAIPPPPPYPPQHTSAPPTGVPIARSPYPVVPQTAQRHWGRGRLAPLVCATLVVAAVCGYVELTTNSGTSPSVPVAATGAATAGPPSLAETMQVCERAAQVTLGDAPPSGDEIAAGGGTAQYQLDEMNKALDYSTHFAQATSNCVEAAGPYACKLAVPENAGCWPLSDPADITPY